MQSAVAPIMRAELSRVLHIMREAARVEIMPRFRALAPSDVRAKCSDLDLVTVADERAESFLTAALRDIWPEALIVGEEASSRDPSLIAALKSAPLAVTIDPIDGTANYAAGVPLFGVMVAIVSYGVPVGSVILDPMTGEAAMALRGEGAWIDRGGAMIRSLRVAAPTSLRRMTGKAAWRNLPTKDQVQTDRTLRSVAAMWDFRCAAHEYLLMAEGRGHFLLYTRSLPWDHLPGWLLLSEAGAYGARFDGAYYDPLDAFAGLLYTPDEASWRLLSNALAIDAAGSASAPLMPQVARG